MSLLFLHGSQFIALRALFGGGRASADELSLPSFAPLPLGERTRTCFVLAAGVEAGAGPVGRCPLVFPDCVAGIARPATAASDFRMVLLDCEIPSEGTDGEGEKTGEGFGGARMVSDDDGERDRHGNRRRASLRERLSMQAPHLHRASRFPLPDICKPLSLSRMPRPPTAHIIGHPSPYSNPYRRRLSTVPAELELGPDSL